MFIMCGFTEIIFILIKVTSEKQRELNKLAMLKSKCGWHGGNCHLVPPQLRGERFAFPLLKKVYVERTLSNSSGEHLNSANHKQECTAAVVKVMSPALSCIPPKPRPGVSVWPAQNVQGVRHLCIYHRPLTSSLSSALFLPHFLSHLRNTKVLFLRCGSFRKLLVFSF